MAFLNGLWDSADIPAELRKPSFAAAILALEPNGDGSLFAMTDLASKKSVGATKHSYFTKTAEFGNTTLGANATDVATTLTVASSAGIVANAVLYNVTTRETVRVASITNATTIVVARSLGDVAAAAMTSGQKLLVIGNAQVEGSSRPTARALTLVRVDNYMQIFRNAYAVTGTAAAVAQYYNVKQAAENEREGMMFHAADIEMAMIFGQQSEDLTGATPLRTAEGIVSSIYNYASGNVQAAGGTTTLDQLTDLMKPAWQKKSSPGVGNVRHIYTTVDTKELISRIIRKAGNLQLETKSSPIGVDYSEYVSTYGKVRVMSVPMLTEAGWNGNALVLDPGAVEAVYLGDRKQKHETYSMENGVDTAGGSLLSELTFEFQNPLACGLITGLTAAA